MLTSTSGAVRGGHAGTTGNEVRTVGHTARTLSTVLPGQGTSQETGTPEAATEPDTALPTRSVDIGWGDKDEDRTVGSEEGAPQGDLIDGLRDMVPETGPELGGQDEAVGPVPVPGDAPVRTSHILTGQLSLISLLLGLGIAALRMRRR